MKSLHTRLYEDFCLQFYGCLALECKENLSAVTLRCTSRRLFSFRLESWSRTVKKAAILSRQVKSIYFYKLGEYAKFKADFLDFSPDWYSKKIS